MFRKNVSFHIQHKYSSEMSKKSTVVSFIIIIIEITKIKKYKIINLLMMLRKKGIVSVIIKKIEQKVKKIGIKY